MKILVLGAHGNLGSELVKAFSCCKMYSIIGWSSADCDVTNTQCLFSKIKHLMPDVIVNTVAYNNVDGCEKNTKEQRKAIELNVMLVEHLTTICCEIGCKLIHFSTNYVFSGSEPSYAETDEPSPINFYGLTKSMGEEIVSRKMALGLRACIIRVSNLFGKKGLSRSSKPCFFEVIQKAAEGKDYLTVIDDEYSCFTYTKDVANKLVEMCSKDDFCGIYHFVNSDPTSWYEAACSFFRLRHENIDVRAVSSNEFLRDAKRPKTAILEANRCLYLRSFKDALQEYCRECCV